MNKEEIEKIIKDPLIKEKVANVTNLLMDVYELGFNNGFKISAIQLDIANKKLDKIKELVNKYGYYTLSEIPELLSIIDGE